MSLTMLRRSKFGLPVLGFCAGSKGSNGCHCPSVSSCLSRLMPLYFTGFHSVGKHALIETMPPDLSQSFPSMAYRLRFDTSSTHEHGRLIAEGHLEKMLRSSSSEERQPLQHLQVTCRLPLSTFTATYGQICDHRPWQPDVLRHPWKRPIRIAEKLWFLEFIEIVRSQNGQPDLHTSGSPPT
jgi:hypothetical protein